MTTDVLTQPTAPTGRAAGAAAAAPAQPLESTGIPLGRLVRVELRKMIDTRSGFGLLAAILLVDIVAVVILTLAGPTESFGYADYLAVLMNVQMIFLPIVGVVAAAGEWSQRTTLQTFALEPRRSRVIVAKLLSALLLMVVISVATAIFAAGGHALSQAMGNDTAGWGVNGPVVLGMIGVLVLMTLMGVAFGLLLHAPAIAIVAFLLLPQVFMVIPLLLPGLAEAFGWIDFQTAWGVLFIEGATTAGEWARAGAATVLWVVVPMLAGWIRTVRREAA